MDHQQWTDLPVSNPLAPLPLSPSIRYLANFLSLEDEEAIILQINEHPFAWEGFEQRHRVQRHSFASSSDKGVSIGLLTLRERLYRLSGLLADQLDVEEYSVHKTSFKGDTYAPNHVVATFESDTLCACRVGEQEDNDSGDDNGCHCSCFVAYIPLGKSAVQNWNRPARRLNNCWDLASPHHWTNALLERGSLLVCQDDFLWNWRNRTMASPENLENVLVLRFSRMNFQYTKQPSRFIMDNFGYIPSADDQVPGLDEPRPPLEKLLTIVVTTSPIKSNPSTELIERAMETFKLGGIEFACHCRKVIICDGFRVQENDTTVSNKYSNSKQAMRNGIVTSQQSENYRRYKDALRKLCETASVESPFYNTVVEELEERHGYGFALRHAVRRCVSTKFVCVIQHDRTFMRPTPIQQTVDAMWRHPKVKYVGMSMRSNLTYRDIFLSRYGPSALQVLVHKMVLRLPEMIVDAAEYGPESNSTKAMKSYDKKLFENILALAEDYQNSTQKTSELNWHGQQALPLSGQHQLTLTPTLFWYDNIHICDTDHYRNFVFHPSYKMVARGGFVEDKLSPVLVRTVERIGLQDGHSRFGCYLLDDHSGMFFTGHLDGGSYMTKAERLALQTRKKSSRGSE